MRTKDLVLCALFSALICISTFFSIPLPITTTPITLQVFAVCICGALLGAKRGTISVVIYVLIGFIGLPVFSGMKGGPSVIIGPTGGFIFGFIIAAFIIGILSKKIVLDTDSNRIKTLKYFASMFIGLIIMYVLGVIQFIFVTSASVEKAFALMVFPFIGLDVIKIIIASFIAASLNKSIKLIFDKN